MQLLKIPTTQDAMLHSISLTGLTVLKQGSYRCRYDLPNYIEYHAREGLRLKTKSETTTRGKKRKSAVSLAKVENDKPAVKQVRYYKIAKKQVVHRIQNYVMGMPGKKQLYFWTVSFPIKTSDDIAYILMNKWLTRLRKERMIGSYLWVAERQQNGTIHFHFTINRRMCVKKANKYMRASIMHCINDGSIDYSRVDAMRYNGVDIAKDRKTRRVTNFAKQNKQKSLSRYLTKYITKNDTVFTRLAWHCSREYSALVTSIRIASSEFATGNTKYFFSEDALFNTDFMTFHKWKFEPPPEFKNHLAKINEFIISSFSKN